MKKSSQDVDLDELLTRSIASILPSRDGFKKILESGRKLKIYIGADATGPDLHIGHATNFIFLEKLRKLGHKIVVLFGDFTAMIGDPTDKEAVRVALSKERVDNHLSTWKMQVGKVMDLYNEENPVEIVKNSTWLSKLSFGDIIKIASNFTVQQMIERDMFEKRLEDKKPIYLHEFLYPLMQGYDSVALDVDAEVGGNDQTFNMLAGRILQKKMNNKEKFVIATTLLVNPKTGQKLMSKSLGGYIGLQDKPSDMFGKVMALPDEAIIPVFIDCTLVSLSEIKKLENDLDVGKNPKDIKIQLAKAVVSLYHDEKSAEFAAKDFEKTFSKGNFAEDAPEIVVEKGASLAEVLVGGKIVTSKTEFRRLISEGAISVEGKGKIETPSEVISGDMNVKVGKHRFVKIKIK